jgi:hypothetical protein
MAVGTKVARSSSVRLHESIHYFCGPKRVRPRWPDGLVDCYFDAAIKGEEVGIICRRVQVVSNQPRTCGKGGEVGQVGWPRCGGPIPF